MSNSNKRTLERKNLIYFPQVFLQENDEEFGRIIDLTQEGFMLVRYEAVENDAEFNLRVKWMAEDGKEEFWNCRAEVCWCKLDKNPDLYAIGFKFVNPNKKTAEEVTRMIRKWSFPEW